MSGRAQTRECCVGHEGTALTMVLANLLKSLELDDLEQGVLMTGVRKRPAATSPMVAPPSAPA